jgi:3-hydroxybutyryl-CoA dehydrogenase
VHIDAVGVVGGGTAGRGISIALASRGVQVTLVEASHRKLEATRELLRDQLTREIARWAITEAERDAILARIDGTTDLEEVAELPIIVEAIHEKFGSKVKLFQKLDGICNSDATFITNTSTLALSRIAEGMARVRRPDLVGLHFLHPVSRVEVVELVRGRMTSDRSVEVARGLAAFMDKEVVEVEEYPGYVTSRLTLVLINEAIHTLMEGVATRDSIDRAMKLRFGTAQGPLALADEMGLDSILRALESMWHELGLIQYRPCPLLRRMVARGLWGEKTGRGFYMYDEDGARIDDGIEDLSLPRLETILGDTP